MKPETKNYFKKIAIAIAIILLGIIVGRIFFSFMKNWARITIVLF